MDAVELMDRAALRSVEHKPGLPDYLQALDNEVAALLVETRAADPAQLQSRLEEVGTALVGVDTMRPVVFTSDPEACATLWNIRKGLFPAVGAVREKGLTGLCCGMPFESKGFPRQAASRLETLEGELLAASREGEYPILCDTSPCALRMREHLDPRLEVFEPVGFIQQFLLPRLRLHRRAGTVALHVTCSSHKMGLEGAMRDLAEACAEKVVIPEGIACCGFAGDRGFTFPELNAAALTGLRESLPAACEAGYSNSRTCEIGLSVHSGIHYRSIVYLVDRCCDSLQ